VGFFTCDGWLHEPHYCHFSQDSRIDDINGAVATELDALISFFIDDIGVTGSLITESIQDLDPTTHVFNKCYVIFLSNVENFIVNLVS
jgi:hypothetical protein